MDGPSKSGSTKREKFRYLAEKRTNNALQAISRIANLSKRSLALAIAFPPVNSCYPGMVIVVSSWGRSKKRPVAVGARVADEVSATPPRPA